MKIVINALPYKPNSSGIGVMIRELFGAYSAFAGRKCQVLLCRDVPETFGGPWAETIHMPFAHQQGLRRIFFQSFRLGRAYCRDAVFLTTDSKMPFFLPRSCKTITLVTDLAVFRLPQAYRLSRVLLWRLQYCSIRRRADRFLTISEFTRREMAELFRLPPEKIEVVPCAASARMKRIGEPQALEQLRKSYGLPERFILFVGNFNPRKNLERMLRAYDEAKTRAGLPHHLVIAGEQGWKFDRKRALTGIRHKGSVQFIGFVPDEDMPALYSAAELFVFPTLYEGFGIPIVEAQCCGTPVLTSNGSALPETGGEGAVYVDPYRTDAICEGMLRVLQDDALRHRLVEKGYQNAKRFSWENSAAQLREIIEKEVGAMAGPVRVAGP